MMTIETEILARRKYWQLISSPNGSEVEESSESVSRMSNFENEGLCCLNVRINSINQGLSSFTDLFYLKFFYSETKKLKK